MRPQEYPYVEVTSVGGALEAMRQATALGPAHPLMRFISLRPPSTISTLPAGKDAAEAVIFHNLSRVISKRLDFHRAQQNLHPTSRQDNGSAIQSDFHKGNAELEAWSVLYYRYVRVDLDLSVEKIAKLTNQPERTLNRRQKRGLARLTHSLALREMRARLQQRQIALKAMLPNAYEPKLKGRDEWIAATLPYFERRDSPAHLLLIGPSGIGKTVLALTLAHRLVNAKRLQTLAWIEDTPANSATLIEAIALQIGLPLALENRTWSAYNIYQGQRSEKSEARLSLNGYLQFVDALIVLDKADALLRDPTALKETLRSIGPAYVILCAQGQVEEQTTVATDPFATLITLEVPPLDQEAAFQVLEQALSNTTTHQNTHQEPDHLARIYEDVGGNPGALLNAVRMGRNYRPGRISVNMMGSVWATNAQLIRQLWLTLYFCARPVSMPTLSELMLGVDQEAIESVLEQAEQQYVVELTPMGCALTPLARTFGVEVIRQEAAQARALEAMRAVAGWLTGYAEADRVLWCCHLLETARRAEFGPTILLDLAYSFGPILEHAGAWLVWGDYLAPLWNALGASHDAAALNGRLWVGLRLGVTLRWLADLEGAANLLPQVMHRAGEIGAFTLQAEGMLELALVYRRVGWKVAAGDLMMRAADHFRRQRDTPRQLAVVSAQIQAYLEDNSLPSAEMLIRQLGEQINAPESPPRLMALGALLALRRHEYDRALNYALEAFRNAEGDLPLQGRVSTLIADIQHRRGEPQAAIDALTWAIEVTERIHDKLAHTRARLNVALILAEQGRLKSALRYLRPLPDEFERLGDVDGMRAAAENIDRLNRALGPS